jgi:hypothetical protein
MYADKDVTPQTAATSAEEAALRFPEIRFGRPLFGSSNGRALRATNPDLKPRISRRVHLTSMTWHTDSTGARTDQVTHTMSNKGHKE